MPKHIVIDTETTGLFRHHNIGPNGEKVTARSDEPGQPRMASFAAILLDGDFNTVSEFYQLVLPVGWQNQDGSPMLEMPEEAFNIHRLSMDKLRADGQPVGDALDFYSDAILSGHIVVGFNQQHDGRQIRAELRHAGRDDLFEQTPNICAMRSITSNYKGQVKKLNGKGGFPRLVDAAAHFGIHYPEDQRHTALEDARVTALVAKRLHERGLLLPAEVHYSRNFEGRQGEVA